MRTECVLEQSLFSSSFKGKAFFSPSLRGVVLAPAVDARAT